MRIKRANFQGQKLMVAALSLITLWLVAVPIGMLLFSSIKSTENRLPFEEGDFTINNYLSVFTSSVTYQLLLTSIVYAIGSLLLGMVIALIISWLLERSDVPFRRTLSQFVVIPMTVPPILIVMAWILLASPSIGLFNVIIRQIFDLNIDRGPFNVYSMGGMILVTGLSLVPSVFLMLSGVFRNMDPSLEEAAEVSGYSKLQTLRFITLPLAKPAILAAAIYFFIVSLETFEIPALLGLTANIHVFSTEVYQATHPPSGLPDYGLASSYAIVFLGIAFALVLTYYYLTRRSEQFVVVTGKGYRPKVIELGILKYAAAAFIVFYFLFAIIFPLVILLWASLLSFYSPPSLDALSRISWDNYNILSNPLLTKVLLNTLMVSIGAATLTMLLSSLIAWVSTRTKGMGRTLLDFMSFITIGIPSVVIGLALIFVYLSVPLPLYGTIWILIIGFTTRFLSFGVRIMGAAMLQIHRELEEAAYINGAGWFRTFFRIMMPLLSPSLVNGWIWVVIHSLREVPIALMLLSTSNVVLSTLIWNAWEEEARIGPAAVYGVLLIIFSVFLTVIGRLIEKRGKRAI